MIIKLLVIKIKPLTEEEKKAKLAELREKMAQKRAAKQTQELLENKANEAIKRKAAKVCHEHDKYSINTIIDRI